MDLTEILEQLRSQLAQVEKSIVSLEQLARAQGIKRRGRPPAWLKRELPAASRAPKKRSVRGRQIG